MGDNVYAIVTVVYGGSYIKDRLHANFDGGGGWGGGRGDGPIPLLSLFSLQISV